LRQLLTERYRERLAGVLSCYLVVAMRSGEGHLTEPTAAARPWQREPLTVADLQHLNRPLLSSHSRPGKSLEGKLDGGQGSEGGQDLG
jgi:hypothetical protein